MTPTGPAGPIVRCLGAHLWRLHDQRNVLDGYIAECGVLGTELRLYFNGSFSFSVRYPTSDEAVSALAFQYNEAIKRGFIQVFPTVASTQMGQRRMSPRAVVRLGGQPGLPF